MAEISSIIPTANYLHVSFTGPYEHLRKIETLGNTIIQSSKEHDCRNLLLDFKQTVGLGEISTIEEHDIAEFTRRIVKHSFRIAFLFPKLSNNPGIMIGKHLENVAINRGVVLKVFWQLDDAVSWITSFGTSIKESVTNE